MDLASVTQETLDQMAEPLRKALTTGITVGTGLQGFELEAPAKFLKPVLAPWRNRVPRTHSEVGSKNANWRAIVDINVAGSSPFVGFGAPGVVIQTSEVDYAAPYLPLALGDSVQMDAQVLARGFDDLRARSGTNLLFALMLAEDKALLGAQNFALQTPAAPTVTFQTTGGSIPNATAVNFVVAVRTVENYYFQISNAAGTLYAGPNSGVTPGAGGGTVTSANGTATTGAGTTNTAQATVAYVPGGVAYDWYAAANTTAYWFVGTTTTNVSPTITALPVADATNPTAGVPGVTPARVGGGNNVRTTYVDTSADPQAINGLVATLAGDLGAGGIPVQRGTATSSGAYFASLDGAVLTGSNGTISQIDTALISLYNTKNISPTRMLMSAQQHFDVSNKMVNTGTFNTFLQGADMAFRQDATGGIYLTKYINKAANGYPIEMETMPNLPPGVIVLISEVVPYPNSQVASVFEVETQQEYQQLEYAMSRIPGGGATGGPRYDVEVRAIEAFKNYFPAGAAVLHNVSAG
jgi:hypothetical protein